MLGELVECLEPQQRDLFNQLDNILLRCQA